jgi:pimeloyl-ACP methyl ester carboxylesterase
MQKQYPKTMNYTQTYQQLKTLFSMDADKTDFPDSQISCYRVGFESGNYSSLAEQRLHLYQHSDGLNSLPDDSIPENHSFSYPVIMNAASHRNDRAIILLHGLNERSWHKYLVWAYYLTLNTGRPVIMFPIAFHMNRSPESWSNPRTMSAILDARKKRLGEVPMLTFANVALSERLSEDPLRFFTSGQQSAADLVQLTRQLRNGEHTLLNSPTTADVFAYSIGAFLAQILFLANPEGLYADSRLFLFCGGAMFNRMDGVSKLIMDQEAFDKLITFYGHELDKETANSEILSSSLHQTELGQSFLSMLSASRLQSFRESMFRKMKKQIQAIALLKDKVIPAAGIMEALNRFVPTEVMDFGHPYTHEQPFPLFRTENDSELVNRSFTDVFSKAALFLA